MTLTVNWQTKVVYSDASITDLPAHHLALRDLEASVTGMLYDDICQWQMMDQGGGAFLAQIDYINGYELEFSGAGPFTIDGNLNCTIRPTGAHVERNKATAFITTAVGGTGPSAESIASAVMAQLTAYIPADIPATVLAALQGTTLPVNATHMNGAQIIGDGSEANRWRGVGVPP